MTYERSMTGWFGKESQDKLTELIDKYNIKTVIEVGSFVGMSAEFFALQNVERVWCIDPFVEWASANPDTKKYGKDFYGQFLTNMSPYLGTVIPIRMKSEEAIDLPFLQADLIYIDAKHDYDSVWNDLALWAPRARKIICGDDYDSNWPGLMRAVDERYPQRKVCGNFWYCPIMPI